MGYHKSFNYWIDTKTILHLTTEKIALKLLRKKHSLKHVLITRTKLLRDHASQRKSTHSLLQTNVWWHISKVYCFHDKFV